MNHDFIRYNIETGKIIAIGNMDEIFIQQEIDEGYPTLFVTNNVNFDLWRVNIDTKEIEAIDPATILPSLLQLPSIPFISDRQFFQQAALDGYITKEDALRAVQSGFVPNIIQSEINNVSDENNRFALQMAFSGSTTFTNTDPSIDLFKSVFSISDDVMDEFFIAASKL